MIVKRLFLMSGQPFFIFTVLLFHIFLSHFHIKILPHKTCIPYPEAFSIPHTSQLFNIFMKKFQ